MIQHVSCWSLHASSMLDSTSVYASQRGVGTHTRNRTVVCEIDIRISGSRRNPSIPTHSSIEGTGGSAAAGRRIDAAAGRRIGAAPGRGVARIARNLRNMLQVEAKCDTVH